MLRKVRCTSQRARSFSLSRTRRARGAAKFIAAGSDIVFEIHYTTTGKPETDRSKVGIVFASGPPQQRYVTTTGINNNRFVIPAHASNYEVKAETTLQAEAQLAWVQPHM